MVGAVLGSAFFGIWLTLSVLVLWRRLEPKVRRHDFFNLIPQWRFFAPLPSTSDFFVLYRDILPNGSFTGWREIRRIPRHWWNGLLFPAKRDRKSELDTAMQLLKIDLAQPLIQVAVSIPYLTILNRVVQIERWSEPESTQFAVGIRNLAVEKPAIQIFCVSGLHRLK